MVSLPIGPMVFLKRRRVELEFSVLDLRRGSMLIFLGDELSGSLSQAPPSALTRALEVLTLGHNEGKHLLTGTREALEMGSHLPSLSSRASATLRNSLRRLPEYGLLKDQLSCFVEVVPPGVRSGDSVRCVSLSWDHFQDSGSIQPTVVLAENQDDARLLVMIGKAYAAANRLSSMKVQADARGGGGSTILQEFTAVELAGERLCLCVADSDKRFPEDGLGATARRLLETERGLGRCSRVVLPRVREMENLIPYSVIGELGGLREDQLRTLEVLRMFEREVNDGMAFHADMKSGLSGRDWLVLGSRFDGLADARRRFRFLWRHGVNVAKSCHDAEECRQPDACTCGVLSGFGGRLLPRVLGLLLQKSPQKVVEALSGGVRERWMELGQEVFSWCCASSPERVY